MLPRTLHVPLLSYNKTLWAARGLAPPAPAAGRITANDVEPFGGPFIAARSPHPDACWAWISFLSRQLAALPDGFPARTSLATGPDFARLAPAGAVDVYTAYQAAFARPLPAEQAGTTFAQGPIDYYWLFQAVDPAMSGADLRQELERAQTRTTQFLACVRGGKAGAGCAKQVDGAYKGWQNATPR